MGYDNKKKERRNNDWIKITDSKGHTENVVLLTWTDLTYNTVTRRFQMPVFITVVFDTTSDKYYALFTDLQARDNIQYAVEIVNYRQLLDDIKNDTPIPTNEKED